MTYTRFYFYIHRWRHNFRFDVLQQQFRSIVSERYNTYKALDHHKVHKFIANGPIPPMKHTIQLQFSPSNNVNFFRITFHRQCWRSSPELKTVHFSLMRVRENRIEWVEWLQSKAYYAALLIFTNNISVQSFGRFRSCRFGPVALGIHSTLCCCYSRVTVFRWPCKVCSYPRLLCWSYAVCIFTIQVEVQCSAYS